MSDLFALDRVGGRTLEDDARKAPTDFDNLAPTAWEGSGEQLKSLLLPAAKMARSGMAVTGATAVEQFQHVTNVSQAVLTGDVGALENRGIAEGFKRNVTEDVGQSAVDYWTPDAAGSGWAAQNLLGLPSQVVGSLPFILGGPAGQAAFIGDSGITPAIETLNAGGDLETAATVGGINVGLMAVGFRLPAAWGSTLATRMATGVGGNVGLGVAINAGSQSTLEQAGLTEFAASWDPLNPQALILDGLMGAAFAAKAHIDAPPAVTKAQADAILTANNADHFTRGTLPGEPRTPEAAVQHQDGLELSIRQALNGEPVNVAGVVDLSAFDLRPELAPSPVPVRQYTPVTDTASAIGAAADELGIDAVDLATVISYETAGTFNPDQRGPTTKWGQHRGLIQFGEPQRAKYGVTDGMTVAEQMQAVVAYLRDTGVKPGMGILDVYSAINAGRVGRYDASDANAGGAPGTVRDKVERQMAAHRRKAQAMFGADGAAPDYMEGAPPRREGETDKAYAKRVIDPMPDPDAAHLVDDPARYFNMDAPGTQLVPVQYLTSSKTDAENAQGNSTGIKRMVAAAEGVLTKREPLDVLRNADGTFTVVDGNSTLIGARGAGFEQLPVRVVGEQSIREQIGKLPDLAPGEREGMAALYEKARRAKPEFDARIGALADRLGTTFAPMLPDRLKGMRRASEKILKARAKGKPDPVGELQDVVRATIVVDSMADIPGAIAAVEAEFGTGSLVDVDNTWAPGAESKGGSGYRDVNLKVDIGGHVAEVQINTAHMQVAKDGPGHKLYEQIRKLEDKPLLEGRAETAAERAELDALEKQSLELYGAAERASTASRNSASDTGRVSNMNSLGLARRGGISDQSHITQDAPTFDNGSPSGVSANLEPGGNVSGRAVGAVTLDPGSGSSISGSPSSGTIVPETRAPLQAGLANGGSLDPARFPAQGSDTTAVTERGLRLPVRYALAELDTLVTSHDGALNVNPAFPAELQPRDRARSASEQQITRIANNLNPELLGASPKAADGAPIVGAADSVVESGNARTIAVRRAYASGKAEGYRAWLADNAAEFGLDPAALGDLQQPMLVRVSTGEYDRAEFARQANESTVATMSATEQAMADARQLPDMGDLRTNDDGTINMHASAKFVAGLIERIGPNERAAMSTADGQLSQQGQTRIRNAVFARAYGDADLVAMLTESTDANVKNVLAGMLRAAPEIARLREMIAEGGRYGPDLAPDLVSAVRKFSQLRSEGLTVAQFEAQGDFFGQGGLTPAARDLLRTVGENARAPKRFAEFLQRYVDAVDVLGDPRQADLMGGAKADPVATAAEGTRKVHDAPAPKAAALFNAAGRPTADAAPAKPDPLAADLARLEEYRAKAAEGDGFYQEVLKGHEALYTASRSALDAYQADGDGTILKHADRDQWAMLLPDASAPGKYRYQVFDRDGFQSHSVHETPEAAAIDAGRQGYTVRDPGMLDELATTPQWADGTEIAGIIQRLNAGQIDYETADAQVAAVKAARQAQVTPENRAAYEAIAAMPDLQIIDDAGVPRLASEFLAQAEADAAQAAETTRAIEAAANCFMRVA